MRFKLDENFGLRCVEVLSAAAHDVATIAGQRMSGAADSEVLEACRREQRCLVTLDLDFSNPLRFPPALTSGIAVVRLPGRASHSDLLNAVATLAKALETESITGKLWIVEVGPIRIYRSEDESGWKACAVNRVSGDEASRGGESMQRRDRRRAFLQPLSVPAGVISHQ